MATQLSEQDFQRLQENLLELKATNYSLAEKERRSKHGLGEATAKIKVLEEALEKANRTVDRSKKAAELQHLTKQNEFLKEKLGFQDEQFRIQNQTLMNELTTLVRRNEELESCLKNVPSKESDSALKDSEIRIVSLEKENQELGDRCEKYQRKISDLQAAKQDDVDTADGHQSSRISELEKELDRLEDVEIKLESTKSELNLVSAHNTELKESMGQLTEKAETLSSELSSTSEGLKRKHELFLEIQQEKENMLTNFSEKERELQTQYNQELQTITERKDRLQTQLNLLQENFTDLKETHLKTTHDFEQSIENMKIQLAESPPEKVKELEAAKNSLANDLTSMADKLEKEMDRSSGLLSELSNYQGQLEELHRQNEANNNSLANMEEELGQVHQLAESRKGLIDDMALQLQKKTDELRNLSKESNSRLEEAFKSKEEEIRRLESDLADKEKKFSTLMSELADAQEEHTAKIQEVEMKLAESDQRIKLVSEDKSKLEEELGDTRDKILELEKNHKVEINELEDKHEKNIQEIFNINQGILKGLETQVELCNVQKVEFEEKNIRLEQELKDALEERKIVEKKGHSMVKDVKRQLIMEKKKNERLQEKMKECFIDTESNHSDQLKDVDADRSSISSWSLMSGNNDRESTPSHERSRVSQNSPDLPTSPLDTPGQDSNGNRPGWRSADESGRMRGREGGETDETDLLLERVASLQQTIWSQEEKLNMLEQSGAAMAEEIFRKNNLIQFYCMEAGRGPGPVSSDGRSLAAKAGGVRQGGQGGGDKMKQLMDRLVHSDHTDLHNKEVVRMQGMLEETLTKNMMLQLNLDTMSQEVVRLSKLAPIGD